MRHSNLHDLLASLVWWLTLQSHARPAAAPSTAAALAEALATARTAVDSLPPLSGWAACDDSGDDSKVERCRADATAGLAATVAIGAGAVPL